MKILAQSYWEALKELSPHRYTYNDHEALKYPFLYQFERSLWLGVTNKNVFVLRRLLSEAEPIEGYRLLGSVVSPPEVSGGWLVLEWDDGELVFGGQPLKRGWVPERTFGRAIDAIFLNRRSGARTILWTPSGLQPWIKAWSRGRKGCALWIEHVRDEERTIIGNLPNQVEQVGMVNDQFLGGYWRHYTNAIGFWSTAFPLFLDGGVLKMDTSPETTIVSLLEHDRMIATQDTVAACRRDQAAHPPEQEVRVG